MKFDYSILREADIRGVYPTQINDLFAKRLGCVFGSYLKSVHEKHCIVGHDNRFGGKELTKNLIEGLSSVGIDVIYIGLVTTPMLNFAARKMEYEYGIMVTASHNPKEDNGFKLFGRNYQHCDPSELEIIYQNLKDKNYKFKKGNGKLTLLNINELYANDVANSISLGRRKLKVVVDCGNGTSSVIAKKVYDLLPIDATFIFADSNPNFPNHHPDPNVKANLKQLCKYVKKYHADMGVSYDGDADRVGFVDNLGKVVEADIIMALMCKNIIAENKNKTILIDVKCSSALSDEITNCGGKYIIETPSSARQERIMAEKNILFGGGYSNHIFFRDRHYGYDDGIYTGLRVQELLSKTRKSLSELTTDLIKYQNTEEIKIKTTDEKKFLIVDKIKEYCENMHYEYSTIDGIKVFKDNGWALLRASNTGPNLTLRFEANTKSNLKNIQKEFMKILENIK